MREPDPRLARVLEQLDEARKLLVNEKKRSGILRAALDKERAKHTTDAATKAEQRPWC